MLRNKIPENLNDLSQFSIVRLNAETFPVGEFEQEAYDRYQLKPNCIEASGNGILAHAVNCDAILVVSESLPEAVIDGLTRCRIISRLGAGTDKIDHAAATRNGILITNVPDFCAEEQADHTMALLLAVARKLPQMRSAMLAGQWNNARATCRSIRRLQGQILGLVGFGLSARGVARRAVGFGLRVIATRRNKRIDDPAASELGVEMTDLETLLRQSDYVSLHLPLEDSSRGMIDAEKLSWMKREGILINTSRGALVNETALAHAIGAGQLGGAGLDTFHDINVHVGDGKPPQNPLLKMDNVVFTPHVAAFSIESARDVGYGGVENVAAVLSGRWPPAECVVSGGVIPRFVLE